MANIIITGELRLDQTSGLQDDDVAYAGLDPDFSGFLSTLGLNAAQTAFATDVGAASDTDLVSITKGANETIGKVFFSDDAGNPFDGDVVPGIFTLDGLAVSLWSANNDSTVLLKASDGRIVGAVYIEPTNAAHTTAVVQSVTFEALNHPNPNDPDDSVDLTDLLRVAAVVTTPAGSSVFIDDDGPTVTVVSDGVVLTVDETNLAIDASGGFAPAFTQNFGTDGPAAANPLVYSLDTPGGASGIFDVATGQEALLSKVGTTIEGRTSGGDLVFVVSINSTTGVVTLDQKRAVTHGDPLDPDDSVTLAGDDLITLTARATDADGDSDAETINIGTNLSFEDDGPSITTTGTAPELTVDETNLALDASANFAPNFVSAFGADSAGSLVYDLGVVDGANSGLTDTATGEPVLLHKVGGVVEGRTAVTNELVFTVSVDQTGLVTLDQKRAVVHTDTNNPDDSTTLIAPDAITLTATITDRDGDSQLATLNIGQNLNFEDDGPTIVTQGIEPQLTVDETVLGTDDTASFAPNFLHDFGEDGAGTLTYELSVAGGPASGLFDTATGEAVNLAVVGGVVEGRTAVSGDLVFTVSVDAAGTVELDQLRAVVHPDTTDPDDSVTLASDDLVKLTATVTDGDGDQDVAVLDIGQNLNFEDDGPTIAPTGTPPELTVDESVFGTNDTKDFSGNFTSDGGEDGTLGTGITYDLNVGAGVTGLLDTDSGEAVNLSKVGATIEARTAIGNLLVFSVSVDGSGNVTLDQSRAVEHADTADPNDVDTLLDDNALTLTATITDRDGDQDSASIDIGKTLNFVDDAPAITQPFDADPGTGGNQDDETIGNAVGQTATGNFGFNIGNDPNAYLLGQTDFASFSFTGTVDNAQNPGITGATMTKTAESASSASFDFSFNYDRDPITLGVQSGTAAGTLSIDKVNDTYTFTMTDAVDGFSFDILHTSGTFLKAPPGNTGHPELVVSQLTDPNDPDPDEFFVQFTANTLVSTGVNNKFSFNTIQGPNGTQDDINTADVTYNTGDLISNGHIDWVSATQATNGVAGDTIQKGELLTLRFFNENILGDVVPGAPEGGTEKINPTDKASGIAIKFDGIGNSEDLVVVLNLIDANGNETTRSVNVQNSDLIKGNANVPFPYNQEFTLDNNDALLIIEQNDYTNNGETFQIQGAQIMQSANGLTGSGINLNGAIGAAGDSNATGSFQTWDVADNDVLKITDIGFIQNTTGTIDANLAFNFDIQDGDGDTTGTQTINLQISNDFIV